MIEEGVLEGAGGVALAYRVLGSAGPTIVAVHGGPGAGMNAFYPHLAPLARDHRVIFYDQRGGGRSTLPEDEESLDFHWFVEDLEAVRRHFRIERMNLVAHSFGALLVAGYAERHPERVERIALLKSTAPRRSMARPRPAPEAPTPAEEEDRRRMREAMVPLLEGTAEDPIAACRRYEALLEEQALATGEAPVWRGTTCEGPPEAVAYYYARTAQLTPRSLGDWDFTQSLADVQAPVLVVSGDRDAALVEQQRAWAEAYPRGRLLVVPGAASVPVATHPETVLTALREFFAGR